MSDKRYIKVVMDSSTHGSSVEEIVEVPLDATDEDLQTYAQNTFEQYFTYGYHETDSDGNNLDL